MKEPILVLKIIKALTALAILFLWMYSSRVHGIRTNLGLDLPPVLTILLKASFFLIIAALLLLVV